MAARPLAPVLALGVAALLGIAAALTGLATAALAPMLAACVALAAARSASVKMWASCLALAAGGTCLALGDLPALMTFLSAAVLGISLVLRESGRAGERPARVPRGKTLAKRAAAHIAPVR
jgi:hypothetical protein